MMQEITPFNQAQFFNQQLPPFLFMSKNTHYKKKNKHKTVVFCHCELGGFTFNTFLQQIQFMVIKYILLFTYMNENLKEF